MQESGDPRDRPEALKRSCHKYFAFYTYGGFPTRMEYLYDDIQSRYIILVGNPGYTHCFLVLAAKFGFRLVV